MYDWANSVYSLVITSTMFPAYYEEITSNPANGNMVTFLGRTYVNTSLYNYALAAGFLIVAIISPILSSIADYRGNKKVFLRFFATLGSLSCMGLYWFDADHLVTGMILFVLACVGFWASLVFYNSYLPEIAAEEDRDRVSAKGFSMGYIGSVILQVICFLIYFNNEALGISGTAALQLSFLLVGIWWLVFAQRTLFILPKGKAIAERPSHNIFANGFIELKEVWRQIKMQPVLRRFLGAFFFYNMGVQTVMLAATLYGKGELQIPATNLIIAILVIQLIAIPGAILMSKLSARIGNLKALMIAVSLWILICIAGYLLPEKGIYEFYAVAVVIGFVMGGIQSLSRSTYAKLMPQTHDTTSYFSFYDVTEKIAIVIGMFSFGYVTELAGGSQRNSVLTLAIYFVIGLCMLFYTFNAEKKKS